MSSNSTFRPARAGHGSVSRVIGLAAAAALLVPSLGAAQFRRAPDRAPDPVTRIERGMTIPVRTNEPINSRRSDDRIYTGIVDRDVRGNDGHLAIPRGSRVELIVRRSRNNSLALDLDSVTIRGQRYAIDTDPTRVTGTSGNDGFIGSILGSITGGSVRGNQVRIPRDTVLPFRLDRPLTVDIRGRAQPRDDRYRDDRDRNDRDRGDRGDRGDRDDRDDHDDRR